MNRKLTKRLLIGGIVVGAGGASYLLYRNVVKALSFQIKKSKIELVSKDGKNYKFKVFLKLSNPSSLKLKLTNQEYDIYLNDVYILRLKNDGIQILQPKSVSELVFDLNLNEDDLYDKIMVATGATIIDKLKFITNLMGQTLRLDSKLSVKWGILPKIPIDFSFGQSLKAWTGK